MRNIFVAALAIVVFSGVLAFAQDAATPPQPTPTSTYTPKFKGDPANSDSESAALGYMRVVRSAQLNYKKKHSAFASSLASLVGQGSFTKRMVATQRGDYTVRFKGDKYGYMLWMTPNTIDATHRAFFMDENGKIRAEDSKQASASSPDVAAK
jgi:hypothetical protein